MSNGLTDGVFKALGLKAAPDATLSDGLAAVRRMRGQYDTVVTRQLALEDENRRLRAALRAVIREIPEEFR